MKEELLNVLNTKLDSINKNIESLNLINTRLNDERENLDYLENILDNFKNEEEGYDINKFSSVGREDFDKCMDLVPDSTKEKFETSSCNYDGLIYLINGINSGVPLTLTDEQREAIEMMINSLGDKKIDYQARIDGILLAKDRLEVSDEEVLDTSKNKYQTILSELDNGEYVSETDEIMTAIEYSHLEDKDTVGILNYLLKYNADVYKNNNEPVFHDPSFETIKEEFSDDVMPEIPETEEETPSDEEPVHEETYEPEMEEAVPISVEVSEEEPLPMPEDENVDSNLVEPTAIVPEEEPVPEDNEKTIELNNLVEENKIETTDEYTLPEVEPVKMNFDDLKNLFNDYRLKLEDDYDESLLNGSVDKYREILDNLKEQDMLSVISKNNNLLTGILTNSSNDVINNILDIVKNDLSIDDDDYVETAKITIDTLPSIFVNEPKGTYNNFIKNIELFKKLNIDLINLFDFSRELLVVDNELLEKNYQLVSKYEFTIDDKNAKYLLALPDVVSKMDYYMEAVYEDNITRKTFDGINIIKTYPSKLDTVCDLTIKRLRYSSENGKKMFGSRENSIAGEVANLKVDVLEIPNNYFETFFNNEFDDITNEEVLSYTQMLLDNKNYDFVTDELLQSLESYRDGMRYVINNINISYNKVLRNYNILINNGIDNMKALEFAICYNLVITKDEYHSLVETLNTLGGK